MDAYPELGSDAETDTDFHTSRRNEDVWNIYSRSPRQGGQATQAGPTRLREQGKQLVQAGPPLPLANRTSDRSRTCVGVPTPALSESPTLTKGRHTRRRSGGGV